MAFHPRTSIIPHSQQHQQQQQQKQRSRKKEETDLFESLPDHEIVGCIKAIGITFTVADLQKPNPAHVQQIFEWFAEVLLNVTRKTVEPAMRAAAEDVCGEFADIFPIDTLDLQGFFASLQKLLFVCGINDFSANDLYKPTHDRLVKILSHLINFVRFREPLVKVIEEHSGKTESVKTRVDALYNDNQEIEHRLEEMRRNRKAMEAQVREKTTRNEDLKMRLLELRRHQEKITTRLEETKQKKGELTAMLEQKRQEKLALKQESAKLRPYVLQSPSALQESLAELRETLNNDKAQIDALERRGRASQTTVDSFTAATAAVASCNKVLEDIAAEMSKVEEAKAKTIKQRDAISEHRKRLRDLERAEAMLNRQLSMWIERRKNLCEQSEVKEREASERMRELEAMRQKLTKETTERTREVEKRRVRIEQIERKMNDLRENVKNEVQATRDEYLKMEAHVKLYISEMEQTIG